LFKLPHPEDELAGNNFITKGLANLRYTEGEFFIRPVFCTFWKFTKMPCAVSGRKYISLASPSPEALPICVENMRLNCRISDQFEVSLTVHFIL
jgi:hypothetical protein